MENYELFLSYFRGRTDVIPKYYDFQGKDGNNIRGYTPICAKSGKPECPKKQGNVQSCSQCAVPDYVPMSESLLNRHFAGELILGIYPLHDDGASCSFIAGDFDNHSGDRNPKDAVMSLKNVCDCQEIPLEILKSKSGAGYHAYIFFQYPVLAKKARVFFHALLSEAGIADDSSFDRMFPNQDTADRGKGFGNLIALPFQNISGEMVNTGFLMPDFETLAADQWDYLSKVEKVTEPQIDALLAEWKIDPEKATEKKRKVKTKTSKPADSGTAEKPEKLNPAEVLSGVPEGKRDDNLFRYACQLRSKGLSQQEIEILVCHSAAQCQPPFPIEQAKEKVLSAMRYEYDAPRLPKDENWLQDALKPQKGDDRKRIGMMLCSYWLQQFDDIEQVKLSLFGWNIPNDPPLTSEELDALLSHTGDRKAYDNFYRAVGLNISHMEHLIFPDNTQEYKMYLAGVNQAVSFDSASLVTRSVFVKKIHEVTEVVIKPPAGKGSSDLWADLITGICTQSIKIFMPEEMTVLDRLRKLIADKVAMFDPDMQHEWHEEMERDVIVYNGNICFKPNAIMQICYNDSTEELKRLERKEINKHLESIGFEMPVKLTKIAGKPVRVFKMPVAAFNEIKP